MIQVFNILPISNLPISTKFFHKKRWYEVRIKSNLQVVGLYEDFKHGYSNARVYLGLDTLVAIYKK